MYKKVFDFGDVILLGSGQIYVHYLQLLIRANGWMFCSRLGDPQASNEGNQTTGSVAHLCLQPQI